MLAEALHKNKIEIIPGRGSVLDRSSSSLTFFAFGLEIPKVLFGAVGVVGVVGVVPPLLVLRGNVLAPEVTFLVLASEDVEEDIDEQGEAKFLVLLGKEAPPTLLTGSGVTGLLGFPLLEELRVGRANDVAPKDRLLLFFGDTDSALPSPGSLCCLEELVSPLEPSFPLSSG